MKDKANYTSLWMLISFGLIIWIILKPGSNDEQLIKKLKSGIQRDTIWNNDTSYVFKLKIDTVYYDPMPEEAVDHH